MTPPAANDAVSERDSDSPLAAADGGSSAARPAWIAPSLLSADFARLGEEVAAVVEAGADLIHFDVMDNHFVPNLTVGPMVCRALAAGAAGQTPIDVHLMTRPVDRLIRDFADAGAAWISIHPEGTDHLDRSLALIRDLGCRAGLVLSPATPLDSLDWTLDRLDLVLVMSVNPGFGGQSFLPGTLPKLRAARAILDRHEAAEGGAPIRLEVDGGVKVENIGEIAAAGADTFVAGSAVFGSNDYAGTIAAMRAAAEAARGTAGAEAGTGGGTDIETRAGTGAGA